MRSQAPNAIHWTASSLLALEASAVKHDVSRLVTVVKRDGKIQMTTLATQCAAFSGHTQKHGYKMIRKETDNFTTHLRSILTSLSPSYSTKTCMPKLTHYPFGGTDVVNALALSKATRCVVFSSAENFATSAQELSNDLGKLLESSAYMRKGANATLFDAHDDFEHLHDELGLAGVGAMAIVRLLGPLAGFIDVVSFFRLTPEGDISFAPPRAAAESHTPHVLIRVGNRAGGERQLLFFVQHNIHVADAGVDAFCGRLHPDILMIKAAPDTLWRRGKDEASAASFRRCVWRSLSPARRANAIVVTDSCQVDPEIPPSIFLDIHQVKSVKFGDQTTPSPSSGSKEQVPPAVFGYGHRVFCSKGHNLITIAAHKPAPSAVIAHKPSAMHITTRKAAAGASPTGHTLLTGHQTHSGAQDNRQRLDWFLSASRTGFEQALTELSAGQKRGHWVWWVFPTLATRGGDVNSQRQQADIRSIDEALSFARSPALRQRLVRAFERAAAAFAKAESKGLLPNEQFVCNAQFICNARQMQHTTR